MKSGACFLIQGARKQGMMGRVLDLELEDPRSLRLTLTKWPSDLIHTIEPHFPHLLLGTVLLACLASETVFAGSGENVNGTTLKCLHHCYFLGL